jgi:hypothetical protein
VKGEVYRNASLRVSGTIHCTRFYSNTFGSGKVEHSKEQFDNHEDFEVQQADENWFDEEEQLKAGRSPPSLMQSIHGVLDKTKPVRSLTLIVNAVIVNAPALIKLVTQSPTNTHLCIFILSERGCE